MKQKKEGKMTFVIYRTDTTEIVSEKTILIVVKSIKQKAMLRLL